MKHKGNVWICMGLLLIAAALFLADFNIMEERKAARTSGKAVRILEETIVDAAAKKAEQRETEIPDHQLNPDMNMPTEQVNGISYIGILQIPSLGLELPIIDTWDEDSLKIAPCRYSGSAYKDRFCICAHNYRSHFGKLDEIHIGDAIVFTDIDGNEFSYEVIDIETISATETKILQEREGSLFLFTCTLSGQNRILVRCRSL